MDELDKVVVLHLAVAISVAVAGMFFHYFKMWLRGQTKSTLLKYMFGKEALKSTLNTTVVVVGTVITMYVSNMISVSTISGLLAIFTLGYTCDSMLNQDVGPK
jgi:hypothetical protein